MRASALSSPVNNIEEFFQVAASYSQICFVEDGFSNPDGIVLTLNDISVTESLPASPQPFQHVLGSIYTARQEFIDVFLSLEFRHGREPHIFTDEFFRCLL